jgi:acyl-CoA reductase-like NAD-dependent aldehyde dehydrogenase
MNLNNTEIKSIVEEVVSRIANQTGFGMSKYDTSYQPKSGQFGIFDDMNEAIESAWIAQKQLSELSLEKRKDIIDNMRKFALANVNVLSELGVLETKMGRVADKIEKNKLSVLKTPGIEDLNPTSYTGDSGLTLVEQAPYGVIGSISPSTNSSETVINNSISTISAGNSVVFNPHPAAKRVSLLAVEILNKAIVSVGGPNNLITSVLNPTLESGGILFTHPKIRVLAVTGGPGLVAAAMKSTKKVIAAGPGNPPVVVDETAIIENAAKSIVNGASFDNNVLCIAEKEVIVVSKVADKLMSEMQKCGGYKLSSSQLDKLMDKIIDEPGDHKTGKEPVVNRNFIGRNANVIAKAIGLNLPDSVRLLFAEVPNNHPLIFTEQLMPVMPVTRVPDVNKAIDLAFEAELGYGHTAMMHSLNVANLSKMAKIMNISIFVKNAPSYAGLGFQGEGFTTFTIASPTGEGLTSARTFTRMRRCVLANYFRIV